MNRISVIIPAYNAASFIAQSVESVLAQTLPAHQVIVINDGSTDNTEKALLPHLSRITYFAQPNKGVSAARNLGIDRATGDYVLFLDADDLLDPKALEVLLSVMASPNEPRIAYGNVAVIDERGCTSGPVLSPDFQGPCPTAARKLFLGGSIPPGAFLTPRWLVQTVGPQDPRFIYGQDFAFWLRCGAHARFVAVGQTVLHYRMHGSSASRNTAVAFQDLIDVRLDFQEWCQVHKLDVLERPYSQTELLNTLLVLYFHRRLWVCVDALLTIADSRQVRSDIIDRMKRYRRFPRWLFTLKDRFDSVRRLVSPTSGVA